MKACSSDVRAALNELVLAAQDYADIEENAYDVTQLVPARSRVRSAAAKAKAVIEQIGTDATRYSWLRDNAGAWEVSRDPGIWTRVETGEKFSPKVYFTAYGTSYGGLTLDEAVDTAKGKKP